MTVAFIVLLLGMIGTGVFAGLETGLYSLNRVRLRFRKSKGWGSAKVISRLLSDPPTILAVLLIWTNVSTHVATSAMNALCAPWAGRAAEVVSTLILAPILVLVGEILPKDLFRRRSDVLVYRLSRFLQGITWLAMPLAWPLAAFSRLLAGATGRSQQTTVLSRPDLAFYLQESAVRGALPNYQAQIAHNIMKLEGISVRRVLIDLGDVEAIPGVADVKEVAIRSRETGHSAFPVYHQQKDRVTGMVDVADLFHRKARSGKVSAYQRDVVRIKPGLSLVEAFFVLEKHRARLGIVERRDRCLGIITADDILKCLLGEIGEDKAS